MHKRIFLYVIQQIIAIQNARFQRSA